MTDSSTPTGPDRRPTPAAGQLESAVRLCVFCGSNAGTSTRFLDVARELGIELADRGIGLVYGGGRVGLMGAVADACLGAGGSVTGVIPAHLVDREVAHESLTELLVTGSMHERKATMARLADGFVALPGGFGTIEETVEILTWNQLGLTRSGVVFVDVDGFYTGLLEWFDHAVTSGFLRREHRGLARSATSVSAAVDLALAPPVATTHKWIDLDRA